MYYAYIYICACIYYLFNVCVLLLVHKNAYFTLKEQKKPYFDFSNFSKHRTKQNFFLVNSSVTDKNLHVIRK